MAIEYSTMNYKKGDPDCLGENKAKEFIQVIYHTTKIESITYDPEKDKIWHIPAKHKPFEFEIIKINDEVQ